MKLLPLLPVIFIAGSLSAAEPITLKLWPNGAPEPAGFKVEPESEVPKKNDELW